MRSGYTFEPTLNANKGGLIETLPSVSEEITVAVGELGGASPADSITPLRTTGYAPVPSWAAFASKFAVPGESDSFTQPFVLMPVANPTTPFAPASGSNGVEDGYDLEVRSPDPR